MASLSTQLLKSAKEDICSHPVLTLLHPAALVSAPSPAAWTIWCCTQTQSAGSVHCHHCETSLLQQQRGPGSAGKKREAQTRSGTAKQGPARKKVVFILRKTLCGFKQSSAAFTKSISYTCFSLFRNHYSSLCLSLTLQGLSCSSWVSFLPSSTC